MSSRAIYLVLPAFAVLSMACADKAAHTAAVTPPPPETVYVKQPEPAAPAVPPLDVTPRTIAFDAIGDTVRLALPAGASCVSATDAVAVVDSTGLVHAVTNGDTHLRCWSGDQNASVKVSVAQQLARVSVVADEGLALRQSGDSIHLTLAHVDRLGTTVPEVRPIWSSLMPEVVRVDPVTGTVAAIADSGTARIVAVANNLADTVEVEIGVKPVSQLLSARSTSSSLARARALARANAARRAGLLNVSNPGAVAPQSVTTPAAQQAQGPGQGIGARAPQPSDSLFRTPETGVGGIRGLTFVPSAVVAFADYRTLPASGALEKTSGALYGLEVGVLTRGLLSFRVDLLTGTLGKDTSTVLKDRKFMSGGFHANFAIAPWLSITGGAESRRFEDVTVQRWLMVRAGGETNFSLGGGPLRGIARIELIPVVNIASDAGTVTSPSFGLASALGLGYENNRVSASLLYDIERYSFPSNSGRKEQFGALLFRFGIRFGR